MSCINIFIIIIGIILIVYVFFILIKNLFGNKIENFNLLSSSNNGNTINNILKNKTVLIFKTHIWNPELELFVKKLLSETKNNNTDFYILCHSDDGSLINKIENKELSKYVIQFNEKDIIKTYKKGYYGMWLSNHWILMWFYLKYHKQYDYFWSIEYDVRITGNSSQIWTHNGTEDFIYPIQTFQDPNWSWRNHYSGKLFNDNTKWYGYLQLARYSKRFLKYLDTFFRKGENGQDEMIIFTLFQKAKNEKKFTGSHHLLNKLINNSWTVLNTDSNKHKEMINNDNNNLVIYHPVK